MLPPALGLGYPGGVQLGALNKQLIIKYFLLEKYEIGKLGVMKQRTHMSDVRSSSGSSKFH